MQTVLEKFHPDLDDRPNWVTFRFQQREGENRPTKVPYNPFTSKGATSNDPTTWSNLEIALKACRQRRHDGVGFVFGADDNFCGIDLDCCRELVGGYIEPWAQAIVDRFPGAYIEVSPSGTGVHIIMKGKLPEGGRKKGGIEMYDRGRFFTMTGNVIGEVPETIADCQSELEAFHAEVFREKATSNGTHTPRPVVTNLNDVELIEKAKSAKNGSKFTELWNGGLAGHPSQSEADQSLVNLLAFWFNCDPVRMDAAFRQSGLYRPKWDERHFGNGNTYGQVTIEKAIAASTEVYTPPMNGQHRQAKAKPMGSETQPEEWSEPQPIRDVLPSVTPFMIDLLPEAFQSWIRDIAERMQCPPDFPAVGVMVSLATVVGRQVTIRPKVNDDWQVVPNLWGGIIGRPGLLKTPALQESLRPLNRLEVKAKEEFDAAMRVFEADKLVHEARQKQMKDDLRKAVRTGSDPYLIAQSSTTDDDPAPTRRRYRTNDPTMEKLGELLNENPRGLLLFRDELTGFLRTMDRDGHESDRAFYLEAWNGTGRFTVDRIGRGTIDIQASCISILGGIQPGPLSAYMSRAAHGGQDDDGLVQRFQLIVWPDQPGAWKDVDRRPDTVARQRVFEVFERLDNIDPVNIGAEVPEEEGDLPFLRFSSEAQEFFTGWRTDLEHRLRGNELPPMLEAHFAKYRSLVPSLALLIHLADVGIGSVGEDSLLRACAWGDYLESHARRVYAPALAPQMISASALAEHIKKGDLGTEFAARDVQRKGWTNLVEREDVGRALEMLEDLDWIRAIQIPTEGRMRTQYLVNPQIYKG